MDSEKESSEREDVKNENNNSDDEDEIDTLEEEKPLKIRGKVQASKKRSSGGGSSRKPFRCTTCNYVTNVKARFTKHVKYHSMPLIKCDFCDFKTPYKWNLDRHLKNHSGEGSLACPLCNFKCDIKQSLTVHVQNHHSTLPDNIGELIKQTLGYGEVSTIIETDNSSYDDSPEPRNNNNSLTLMRRNSSSPLAKRRSLTITVPKRIKRDFIKSDFSSNDGKVSKLKCQYCNFRTPRQGDLNRHVNRCHLFKRKSLPANVSPTKPLPCLIPIKSQKTTEESSQKTENNQKMSSKSLTTKEIDESTSDSFEEKSEFLKYFALTPVRRKSAVPVHTDVDTEGTTNRQSEPTITTNNNSSILKRSAPRRRTSFFEKLTQKLVANSKSEEGSHASGSSSSFSTNSITITSNSTRCQYCRHRCKTSIDLIAHLGKCPEARMSLEENPEPEVNEFGANKVFVWNSSPIDNDEYDEPEEANEIDEEMKSTETSYEDYDDLTGYEMSSGIGDDMMDQGNSVTTSRKVYKCPQQNCGFWATTASRFHVHIVGHYNLKPFECSQCSYRSNWRWDITKHIRLKSLRDSAHNKAKVLLTHESGERNYRKYDRYLVGMDLKYSADSKLPDCSTVASKRGDVELNPPSRNSSPLSSPSPHSRIVTSPKLKMPKLTKAPATRSLILESLMKGNDKGLVGPPPVLKPMSLSTSSTIRSFVEAKMLAGGEMSMGTCGAEVSITPVRKAESPDHAQSKVNHCKKPVWKCKKCPFKHPNKETVLIHLRQKHKPKAGEAVSILNQNNLTAVGEDGAETDCYNHGQNGIGVPQQYGYDALKGLFKCRLCPFFTTTSNLIEEHLEIHSGKQTSHFTCAYCFSMMSSRRELLQHMKVHGSDQIGDDNVTVNFDGLITPKETPPKPRGSSSMNGGPTYKKYHCMECPYVTDSKGQFLYHKQFHIPRDALFKCNSCSYNVSHKHLLHQHIRVHGTTTEVKKQEEFEEPEEADLSDDTLNMRCSEDETLESSSRPTVLVWKNGRPFRMLRCKFCPQVFGKLTDVKEHEDDHNQDSFGFQEAINLSMKNVPKVSFIKKETITTTGRNNLLTMTPTAFVSPVQPKSVLYVCDECPARFFYEKELKIHHTFHVKTSEFQCELCSYSARQQAPHLMSHMKVHGREYQIKSQLLLLKYPKAAPVNFDSSAFPTPISISPSNQKPGASGSTSTTKPDASIKCQLCPATFNTTTSFQRHSKNHGRNTPFMCRYCKFGADTLNQLTLHEILHAGSEVTIEPDHIFQTAIIEVEQKSVEFPDELNGGVYLGNPEFIYPTYIKNGRVKSKRYKCNKCPSAFEKRDQYRVHIGLHGSDQRYKCTVCDYAVTYYANFIQHLKKHSNQPNVPPELLIVKPMSKIRNEALQSTKVTTRRKSSVIAEEEGEILKRPIKCGRCPYTTKNTKSFEDHISHHVIGNENKSNLFTEKCPFCSFMVSNNTLLRDHIRLHFNVDKNTPTDTTHMFLEDIEISIKKGDKNETLYCEKENYNNKTIGNKSDITIVDIKYGLPVSFLNRSEEAHCSEESE